MALYPIFMENCGRRPSKLVIADILSWRQLLKYANFVNSFKKREWRLKILYGHPNGIIFEQMKYFLNKNRQFDPVGTLGTPGYPQVPLGDTH